MFSRTALYVVLHRRHLNNARSDHSTKLGTFVVASTGDCSFYSCSLCTITWPTEGTHCEAYTPGPEHAPVQALPPGYPCA